MVETARAAVAQKQWSEGRDTYLRAVGLAANDSEKAEALLGLGSCYEHTTDEPATTEAALRRLLGVSRQTNEALRAYKQVAALAGATPAQKAEALLRQGALMRGDPAIAVYKQAAEMADAPAEKRARAYEKLGSAHMLKRQATSLHQARDAFQKGAALEGVPVELRAELLERLAKCQKELKAIPEARSAYLALADLPGLPTDRKEAALLEAASSYPANERDAARTELARLRDRADLTPATRARAQLILAGDLWSEKLYADGISAYERFLAMEGGTNAQKNAVLLRIGDHHQKQKDYDKAQTTYRRAEALPTGAYRVQAIFRLGALQEAQAKWAEARAEYSRLLGEGFEDSEKFGGYWAIASIYVREKNLAGAREAMVAAVALKDLERHLRAKALFGLGQVYQQEKDYAHAGAQFIKVLSAAFETKLGEKIHPDLSRARRESLVLLQQVGKALVAEKQAEAARALYAALPPRAERQQVMAAIELAAGDAARAAGNWEEAAKAYRLVLGARVSSLAAAERTAARQRLAEVEAKLAPRPAAVPGAILVKDIWPGKVGSGPQYPRVVNDTLFFAAASAAHGLELWKSDGSEAGTVMVKDIRPGPGLSGPREMVDKNGTLFFTATDGKSGRELWKSDGTEAGTVLVKDINPGAPDANPTYLAVVDGKLYFAANDGASGYELWRSDGTEAGTVRVKDIRPGAVGSAPRGFTLVNGVLFFVAHDGTHGVELWRTDGTEAGTALVKDILPGRDSSDLLHLASLNGTLYFSAKDATSGRELWKSDGTEAGTLRVKDIQPGAESSHPKYLTSALGKLFFMADDGKSGGELWCSDGTEAGTLLVKDILPGKPGSGPYGLIEVNGTLLFSADGGAGRGGKELWKSDGTEAGTVRVKDINPGGASSSPAGFVLHGGVAYFGAVDPAGGGETWKSDGTEAGTVRVTDIAPGPGSCMTQWRVSGNGALYLCANDGVSGPELWALRTLAAP